MSGQVVSARKGCTIIAHHHDNDASRDIAEPRTSPRPHRPSPSTRGRVSPGSAGDGGGVREAERGEGDE